MKKLAIVICTLLTWSALAAPIQVDLLSKIYGMAEGLYAIGNDNNWIGQVILNKKDFYRRINTNIATPLNTHKKVHNAVKECVFFADGAYGPHLSTSQQEMITEALAYELDLTRRNHLIRLYKVNNIGVDDFLFAPDCVLVVKQNSKYLLLQGGTMD